MRDGRLLGNQTPPGQPARGWLHTGDLGGLDAAGFLTIKDRSKDMIISGGSTLPARDREVLLSTRRSPSARSSAGRTPNGAKGRRLYSEKISCRTA